jgi:hypothetical protein
MTTLEQKIAFLLIEVAGGRLSVIDLRARLAQSDRDISSVGIESASDEHLEDREAIKQALAEIDERSKRILRHKLN